MNIDFCGNKSYNKDINKIRGYGVMRIKKAFTLAEMMIVFIVIGVIIALGVTSTRPWEKAYKYAYIRMYHALSLATYNHMVNANGEDAFPTTRQKMCEALLEYINTANNKKASECSANASDYLDANAESSKFDVKTGKAPNIITSNGLRIWIGGTAKSVDGKTVEYKTLNESIDGATDTVRYFVVYVDLNGERTPNTATWSKEKMADVVAFAITDKYIVIPLGYPLVDSRYMEANVVYPTIDTDVNDDKTENYTGDEDVVSEAMTYYEAMVKAYALEKNGKIKPSLGNVATYLYDFNKAMFLAGNTNRRNFWVCGTKSGNDIVKCESKKTDESTGFRDFYETNPSFDEINCDSEGYTEPICSVKIYDYH